MRCVKMVMTRKPPNRIKTRRIQPGRPIKESDYNLGSSWASQSSTCIEHFGACSLDVFILDLELLS